MFDKARQYVVQSKNEARVYICKFDGKIHGTVKSFAVTVIKKQNFVFAYRIIYAYEHFRDLLIIGGFTYDKIKKTK